MKRANFLLVLFLFVYSELVFAVSQGISCHGISHTRCSQSGYSNWHCMDRWDTRCVGSVLKKGIEYETCNSHGGCSGSYDAFYACSTEDQCGGKTCGTGTCGGSCGTCPADSWVGSTWCSGLNVMQVYRTHPCNGTSCDTNNTNTVKQTCVDQWLTSPVSWCTYIPGSPSKWNIMQKYLTAKCDSGMCDPSNISDQIRDSCNPNAVPNGAVTCNTEFNKVQNMTRCVCRPGVTSCVCDTQSEIIGSCVEPLFTLRVDGANVVIGGVDSTLVGTIPAVAFPAAYRHLMFMKNNKNYNVLNVSTADANATKVRFKFGTAAADTRALYKYNPTPSKCTKTCPKFPAVVPDYYGPSGQYVDCGNSPTCVGGRACSYTGTPSTITCI